MTAPQASLRVAPGSRGPPARDLRSAPEQGQGDPASELSSMRGGGPWGAGMGKPSQSRQEEIGRGAAGPRYSEKNQWAFNFHTITVLFNLDLMCFWNP